jgi:hypothetical protein
MENINEKESPKYTFEAVWQGLMETRKLIEENATAIKETNKQIFGYSVEADKRNAELTEKIKETNKQIGGMSKSNGAMAQEAIFHILEKEKNFAGINFDDITSKVPIMNGVKTVADIDVLMLNGDTAALIEVKYKVAQKDVNKLIFDTVVKFKENFPVFKNYKILLGVGGMSFDEDAIKEAEENGVGIIKIIGDKVEYHTEGIKTY